MSLLRFHDCFFEQSWRLTEAQTWDVDNLGVRIFLFHESGLATMRSLLETALLFTPLHTKGLRRCTPSCIVFLGTLGLVYVYVVLDRLDPNVWFLLRVVSYGWF